MDNIKHTPGPWITGDWTAFAGLSVRQADGKSPDKWTGPLIARVVNEAHYEQCSANARLIAAAPEMYEALKNALNTIRALTEDYDTRQSFIKGQELIARVEGEL